MKNKTVSKSDFRDLSVGLAFGLMALLPFTAASAQENADAGNSSGGEATDLQLGDIVVVAQKRSENLQDVPIAITAITGAQLGSAGVSTSADLTMVTPSLNVGQNVSYFLPRLRGVGNATFGPGIENAVATYVDGVYIAAVPGSLLSLNNIERIEILKGPQGTLFGRNATGGVINVISKDPSSKLGIDADLSYGNYETLTGNFYVTGGSDTLAADLAVHGSTQGEGYGRNLVTGQEINKTKSDIAVRGSLLFTPSSDTKVRLSVDYADRDGSYPTLRQAPNEVPLFGPNTAGGPWDATNTFDTKAHLKDAAGVALRINQKISGVELVSITAYRRLRLNLNFDYDLNETPGLGLDFRQYDRQFSQEFQLVSKTNGPFRWMAGAYYFWADSSFGGITDRAGPAIDPTLPISRIVTDSVQKTESIAGFGQATLAFTDTTNLTLGVRYTEDRRTLSGATSAFLVGDIPIGVIQAPAGGEARKKFSKVTWRASLDHNFSRDVMAYASFNRGFKGGGFNATLLSDPSYDPEVLDAYELGVKAELFDKRLRMNVAGFYYDYTNLQVRFFPPTGQIGIKNGASAKIYGLDVDFVALLTRGLRLTGGFTYLDAKFGNYPNADSFVPLPTGGSEQRQIDASGNEIPYAPKFSGTLGVQYTVAALGGELTADVNGLYNDGFYTEVDEQRRQGNYVLLNAGLTWTSPSETYSVSVWGKNLTDEPVLLTYDGAVHASAQSYQPPRTYGVTLGVRF